MHHFPREKCGDEAGASTAEYLAVIVLVASMALVIAPAGVATSITGAIRAAFCQLSGGSCPSSPTALSEDQFRPDSCDRSERIHQGNVELSVAVIEATEGFRLSRTEKSDGNTTFTLTDTEGLGLAVGAGAELRTGGLIDGELGVDGRAGWVDEDGLAWTVNTEDADEFEQRIQRVRAGRAIDRLGGAGKWLGDKLFGPPEELPEPDMTIKTSGLTSRVGASAEIKAGVTGRSRASDGASGEGKGVEEGPEGELVVGGSASHEGHVLVKTVADAAEETITEVFDVSGTYGGEFSYLIGKSGSETTENITMSVKRDARTGDLQEFAFETVTSGSDLQSLGSNLPEVTALLNNKRTKSLVERRAVTMRGPSERELFEDVLDGGLDNPAVRYRSGELLRRAGRNTVAAYDTEMTGGTYGGRAALGVKLGGFVSGGTSESTVVDLFFEGVPDAAGARDLVRYDCFAGG